MLNQTKGILEYATFPWSTKRVKTIFQTSYSQKSASPKNILVIKFSFPEPIEPLVIFWGFGIFILI